MVVLDFNEPVGGDARANRVAWIHFGEIDNLGTDPKEARKFLDDAAVVVDAFREAIKTTLEGGSNIEIRGFGTFKVKERKARKARNPRTGEEVPVANRMVPVFKPSNEFKNMITRLPVSTGSGM